jgi:hypothetical protein
MNPAELRERPAGLAQHIVFTPQQEADMDLHFSWNEVEKLLDEVRAATATSPLYEQETGKGLWLVGDDGVYLMANTKDGPREKQRKKDERAFVVYANECNPKKLAFDEWWANKQASFGGDDGIEFLGLPDIEGLVSKPPKPGATPQDLIIRFMPGELRLEIAWKISLRPHNLRAGQSPGNQPPKKTS